MSVIAVGGRRFAADLYWLARVGPGATARAARRLGRPWCVHRGERVYRQEALAHAGAVEAAWRRLETFILEESGAATSWPGAVPPAGTGWQTGWTARGLEARYCDDVLLVYLAPAALKGTGSDHRAVHAAPHAYDGGDRPVLHWLESGTAHGGAGRAGVTLPACLSAAGAGGPLPSGRAALAGGVRDPFVHLTDRVTRETRQEPCPDGEHGTGRTLIREATQAHDGRGNPAGDPVFGPWELSIDLCRADYSQWEHYTLACHWDAGPPHNRRMEGREVWRRLKTVTAGGESLGPPQFVSTSCWTGEALPPPPEPEIGETTYGETKSGSCPAGYTGSLGYRRTVTLRSTRFAEAVDTVIGIHREGWKDAGKSEKQWRASLRDYAMPRLGWRRVDQITTADVMAVLIPHWHTKNETMRRVRQRIGAVMKWAVAQGYRDDNPAGDAISAALPKNGSVRRHQRALPFTEVGAALAKVRTSGAHGLTALAFEFLVLTACRSGEVRLATWDEVDLESATWTVPANRMKAKRDHRVPLSARALQVLEEARAFEDGSGLVFPSPRVLMTV